MPKATVQASIGPIALAYGLSCGEMVLTAAVIAILLTAPIGAILMDVSYKHLLNKQNSEIWLKSENMLEYSIYRVDNISTFLYN